MRTSLRRCLAAVGITSAIATGAAGFAPVAATASTAVGTIGGIAFAQSGGASAVSDPTRATALSDEGDQLVVSATRRDGQGLTATIVPASDVGLTAGGTYPLAERGVPGGVLVYVSAPEGSSCTPATGQVSVLELTRDDSSALTSLAADWQGTCTSGSTTYRTSGQVRWNATTGYSGLEPPTVATSFGKVWVGDVSAARTITWTAQGTQPVTVPAAVISGDQASWFLVSRDGCAGQTLKPDETCSVSVKAAPRSGTTGYAAVRLGDGKSGPSYGLAQLSVDGAFGAKGTYRPLSPARLLDTRSGLGARKAVVGPGGSVTFTVLGRGGVPSSGVGAVVLNVTAVGTTATTYLTAYPAGSARPNASGLNAPRGYTGANTLTVRPGAKGAVTVYNHSGSVNLVADVTGFYRSTNAAPAESDYVVVQPERVVDTRQRGLPLRAGYWMDLAWAYDASVGQVQAYALNVTVTGSTGPGYLTVWSGVENPRSSSTVNFVKGATRANTVVAQASYATRSGTYGPGFGVYNGMSSGLAHVIVDIVGVYVQATEGEGHLRFKPLSVPTRIVDSRRGLGAKTWTVGSTRTVSAPSSVAGWDTWALVGNATLVQPTRASYLTQFAVDDNRPPTSNVNAGAAQIVANGATVELGSGNRFKGYNHAGTANVLYDVAGSFELFPSSYHALGVTPPATAGASAGRLAAASSAPSSAPAATGRHTVGEALRR
ncbi:hypothetical protein [Terrabacter sp. NPDC080008]|uniref:hypothetical protein n=1 Tax=Terrabacter sp. NPDC080008 TaxID=3155176 RepID=UPI00344F7040